VLKEIFSRTDTQTRLGEALADPAISGDPKNAQIVELLTNGASNPAGLSDSLSGNTSFLNGASPELTSPFVEGFASSAQSVYSVALVVAVIAFVMSWFVKTEALREKSGIEEHAAAAGH
jgi:hypothetical protein